MEVEQKLESRNSPEILLSNNEEEAHCKYCGRDKKEAQKKISNLRCLSNFYLFALIVAILALSLLFFTSSSATENQDLYHLNLSTGSDFREFLSKWHKKRVLLVTNALTHDRIEKDDYYSPMDLFEFLSYNPLYSLETKSPTDQGLYKNDFMLGYDCVVLDLKDYGYRYKKEELLSFQDFVKKGGNLLVTHDHFDSREVFNLMPEMITFMGLEPTTIKEMQFLPEEVKVIQDHPIFHSFYDFKGKKTFEIRKTHRIFSMFVEGKNPNSKCLLEGDGMDYLVVTKQGKGNIVYIRAGHPSDQFFKGGTNSVLTGDERKLFSNILMWLLYGEK